jgi:hypothetical protein
MRLPHTLLILATAWLEVLAAPTDSLSASSFYVPSLPGLWGHPPSLKIWAGHINSDLCAHEGTEDAGQGEGRLLVQWRTGM